LIDGFAVEGLVPWLPLPVLFLEEQEEQVVVPDTQKEG
jgi:hypothetical protein